MKKKMKKIFKTFCILLCLFSCNNGTTEPPEDSQKQINIVVLLDLSDRIIQNQNPDNTERDINIVHKLVDFFKVDMEKMGAYKAKGKIKVIFSPIPQDPNINALAQKLDVDLSCIQDVKQKKYVYENISDDFETCLQSIYSTTIQKNKWIGCDIWRFFKEEIDLYLEGDDYRNVLVVVTDGYIYHQNSIYHRLNRYSYLTSPLIRNNNLSDMGNLEEKIEKLDFGIISTRNDLNNVEVLFLELNPSITTDYDVMKSVLSKWCKEMGINKMSFYKTDLTTNTERAIDRFLK